MIELEVLKHIYEILGPVKLRFTENLPFIWFVPIIGSFICASINILVLCVPRYSH